MSESNGDPSWYSANSGITFVTHSPSLKNANSLCDVVEYVPMPETTETVSANG